MAKKYDATADEISFFEMSISPDDSVFQSLQDQRPIQTEDLSFFEESVNAPLPTSELPWYQSIPNAVGKGLLNGLQQFGQAFGPLPPDKAQAFTDYINQQQQANSQDQVNNQNSTNNFGKALDQFLPTNEGFAENTIARAGNILPFLLTGNIAGVGRAAIPEARIAGQALAEGAQISSGPLKEVLLQRAKDIIGPIGRSLAGGTGGAVAESYGAPEWVQGLAEIPGQIGPSFGSKLIPNKNQAGLVQEARKLGLTDQQITPLIQGKSKSNVLGSFAEKRFITPGKLKNSYEAINRTFDGLASRPDAKKSLNQFQFQRFASDIQEKLKNMPAGLREIVREDLQDLLNGNRTGNEIINFFRDLNHYIADPKLNASQLGLLKGPITTALGQLSPDLARDFNTTNKLYAGYKNIASKLSPSVSSDLMQAGKAGLFLHGIVTGNLPEVASVIGYQAASMMASEILTNPRFQNYSAQIVSALNKNQVSAAKKILESMTQYAREVNPDLAVYLQQIPLPGRNTSETEDQRRMELQRLQEKRQ
jgi:hypothetical protein